MPQIINGVSCRSKIESLQHIIKQAKKGKIGPNVSKRDPTMSCFYQYPSGNNCAVGSLFSEAQLKQINTGDHNEESIGGLAVRFGEKNIEAVTGMSLPELKLLQQVHDEAVQAFAKTDEERVTNARQAVIEYATEALEKAQAKV